MEYSYMGMACQAENNIYRRKSLSPTQIRAVLPYVIVRAIPQKARQKWLAQL